MGLDTTYGHLQGESEPLSPKTPPLDQNLPAFVVAHPFMPARPATLASLFAIFCTADTANSTKEPHAEASCQEFRSAPPGTALVPDQAEADN